MPFKDIDYKKLDQSRELEHQLRTKIAVINKTADPNLSAAEKIASVELITGKTLRRKPDPVRGLLKEEEIAQSVAPIVTKLEAIADVGSTTTSSTAKDKPVEAIAHTPPGIFTEEDLQYYQEKGFPSLDEVEQADQGTIQEGLRTLTTLNKKLGNQKRTITNRLKKHRATDHDIKRYEELSKERERIDKYKARVAAIMKKSGKGFISAGQYVIPRKRLRRDNILSVRYAKNPMKIVPAFGATRVSNNVKKVLFAGDSKAADSLSKNERDFIDKLFVNAGQTMTPSQARAIRGSGVFTSVQEIAERAQVLLGELQAGNTSIDLRNELADLLHYLYKHKKVDKTSYTNLIQSLLI